MATKTIRLISQTHSSLHRGVEFYEWKVGPLNLLRACRKLPEQRKHMIERFGNIGAGRSWIEYDGYELHPSLVALIACGLKETHWFLQEYPSGQAYENHFSSLKPIVIDGMMLND